MRILNKPFAALFMAAALMLGAGIAHAQGNVPAYQMEPYGQQLTPEQMDKARKIWNDAYAEMENTRQALAARRAELDRQLASPNPDRDRITALSREIGELRGRMLAARVDARDKMAAQGLPSDCYGRPWGNSHSNGYGPCWGGYGMGGMMDGNYGNGWRHHGHGWGGHRGGCWQ